jgi:hypothetical protein
MAVIKDLEPTEAPRSTASTQGLTAAIVLETSAMVACVFASGIAALADSTAAIVVEFIAENFSGLASTSILVRIGIILRCSEKERRNEARRPGVAGRVVEAIKPSPDPTEDAILLVA